LTKCHTQDFLYKLQHYGINGPFCFTGLWISYLYLSNREQRVILDGASSISSQGVPQGSVLGPLLYIPTEISSTIRLYADDVIIYKSIVSTEDVLQLQLDLEILSKDCLMSFNLSKCKHLIITNNQRLPITSDYHISRRLHH